MYKDCSYKMFHVKRFVVTFFVRTNMYFMTARANLLQATDNTGHGGWLNGHRYVISGG